MAKRDAGENGRALRALALVAVVVGLVALTTAACVLSYSSVHDFALRAGISRSLAKFYPDICDAMLVMAGCSVLSLRGAGLLSKAYAWVCFILLLGALAASSAVHEAGLSVPLRAAEITAAVFPWAVVLVAFGLLLALLRHTRRRRQGQKSGSAAADALASSRAALEPPALEPGVLEPAAAEPGVYEPEGYDSGAYEGTGEYEGGEPQEYGTLQATSQYPAVSPEPVMDDPATQGPGAVSPAIPLPRPSVEPDDAPTDSSVTPPRAVVGPTEMQLRARAPRQPQPAEPPTEPQPAGPPAIEPPAGGYTGDTIPRGELNPAPTSDQATGHPPELDRPRSSPTPPS